MKEKMALVLLSAAVSLVTAAITTALICDQDQSQSQPPQTQTTQPINRVEPIRTTSSNPDFIAVLPEDVSASHRRNKEMKRRFEIAAETGIKRVSPYDFAEIPIEVREHFVEMDCMIPQIPDDWPGEKPMNFISGEFAVKGQDDYAALCSRDGSSAIVVLWGGNVNCPSFVSDPQSDAGYLQSSGPPIVDGYATGVIFSRMISTFPPDIPALHTTDEVFRMDGDEKLPDIRTHDAINDYFLDKAGSALYCHEGEWIEFVTSD